MRSHNYRIVSNQAETWNAVSRRFQQIYCFAPAPSTNEWACGRRSIISGEITFPSPRSLSLLPSSSPVRLASSREKNCTRTMALLRLPVNLCLALGATPTPITPRYC